MPIFHRRLILLPFSRCDIGKNPRAEPRKFRAPAVQADWNQMARTASWSQPWSLSADSARQPLSWRPLFSWRKACKQSAADFRWLATVWRV